MTNWQQIRLQVLERDGFVCQYCGCANKLDVHHIIPRRNGGLDTLDNLISYCRMCHRFTESGYKLISFNLLQYVGKIHSAGKDKFHVIVPKQFNEKIKDLTGKQVKIILDDEL
jgi:5-methylcytosine-specific restriction endonuclease McrA